MQKNYDKTIDDDEFIKAFSKFESKNTSQSRYLLTQIEKELTSNEKIIDIKEIHVEHILPKSNEHWKFNEEIHADNLNKFGNLTLLGSEYNIQASNQVFSEKMLYKKSNVELTKDLLKYENWTADSINARQEELATLANSVWCKQKIS